MFDFIASMVKKTSALLSSGFLSVPSLPAHAGLVDLNIILTLILANLARRIGTVSKPPLINSGKTN